MRLPSIALAVLLAAGAAYAAPPVAVSGAWARATAPMQDEGAVYLSLTSEAGDRLVSVSTPDASGAMLHRTTSGNGMSGMADMDDLDLPAGRTVRLEPRGMHVMLMGLKHPLVAGGVLDMALVFAKAGTVRVRVPVVPIGASGPAQQ